MADRKRKILIVDDDQNIHLAAKYMLRDRYECVSAYNGDEAKVVLQGHSIDLILLDIHMRYHEEGLKYLPILKEIEPDVDVIMVSSNTELDLAGRAIQLGASAYLIKEHSAEQLQITIESVLKKRQLLNENNHYVCDRKRILEKNQIVGSSAAVQQLMKDIEKVRRSMANVIITAETGCGKELVARHIGANDRKPFVAVDSATITSSMAESILFGHEKGAFTGAQSQARGLFEEANGGTIYFDEISNMPLEIQAKLLRIIQEKEVTRLGSTKVIPLNFRVICASNKDLEKLVAEGKFKEDLYQRLNVISLRIPPLRERKEDLGLLISHFLKSFRYENSPKGFSDSAMHLLQKYQWPGNVRELSNLIANLCTMVTDQELVNPEDLPARIREASFGQAESLGESRLSDENQAPESIDAEEFVDPNMDFYKYMHRLEGKVLNGFYKQYGGNISQMSKTLRISRSHLYSKLHAHQIHQ
ncbi:MAG: sigma-54 dependent transcriptional regulator [Bdellovibrionota bacterium]